MKKLDLVPNSPESRLRETVTEIVYYHAEPTYFQISDPILLVDGDFVDAELGHEVEYSPDTIATKNFGCLGALILTQEIIDPESDEQLPFCVSLRAGNEGIGTVFAHITVPEIPLPDIRPAKRQKGRPSIGSSVVSNEFSDFERDVLLNEIASTIQHPKEKTLLGLIYTILSGVPKEGGKNKHMSELQMNKTDEFLNRLFWDRSSADEHDTLLLRQSATIRRLFGQTQS